MSELCETCGRPKVPKKQVNWTLIGITCIMCIAFGVVEVFEADTVSTDEFRRWVASVGTGIGSLYAFNKLTG